MLAVTLLGLCVALSVSERNAGVVQLHAGKGGKAKTVDGMRNEDATVQRATVHGRDAARASVKKPDAKAFKAPPAPQSAALAQQSQNPTLSSQSGTQTFDNAGNSLDSYAGVKQDTWVSTDKNWCRHLYTYLHVGSGHEKTKVKDCAGPPQGGAVGDKATCEDLYKEVSNGTFQLCMWANGACNAEQYQHQCSWSFFMEDLMLRHQKQAGHCHSDQLEAKRSLDGLLHAVRHIQERIYYWNTIITHENRTIRDQLAEQQDRWVDYVDLEHQCMEWAKGNWSEKVKPLMTSLETLEAIADPDVRSAVNFVAFEGEQQHLGGEKAGYTKSAAGTYVKQDPPVRGEFNMPDALKIGDSLTQVEPHTAQVGSFVEVSQEECDRVLNLIIEHEKDHNVALLHTDQPATTRTCDQERTELNTTFHTSWDAIQGLMNSKNQTIFDERSGCLSDATFTYKYEVEGPGKIDFKIQESAQKIHEAQYEISLLEPRLHDVEHGSERMRTYIKKLEETCGLDDSIWNDLRNVQKMIKNLKECPGRNDFTIEVPSRPTEPFTTPSPTPWYQRPAE